MSCKGYVMNYKYWHTLAFKFLTMRKGKEIKCRNISKLNYAGQSVADIVI